MKKINDQFIHNLGIMSEIEFERVSNVKVVLVGLGGLGGYIANYLIRLGVTNILLVDIDIFDETNLNRQLFSNHTNIGEYKGDILKHELKKVNHDADILVHNIDIRDVPIELLNQYDYMIDAVDNIETKIYLEELCEQLNIALLHGACAGWYGQVGWISPGSKILRKLYSNDLIGLEKELKNPSFTPSVIAGYMVSEFVKMIIHSEHVVLDKILFIDLLNNICSTTERLC